jgi:hypothetical protein
MSVGDVFGRLTVVELLKGGKALVRCECGTEKVVWRRGLKQNNIRSCGCLAREISRQSIVRAQAARKAQREAGK